MTSASLSLVSGYGDRFTKLFANIMAIPELNSPGVEKRLSDLKEFKSIDVGSDGFSSLMNTGPRKDGDFR